MTLPKSYNPLIFTHTKPQGNLLYLDADLRQVKKKGNYSVTQIHRASVNTTGLSQQHFIYFIIDTVKCSNFKNQSIL